MCFFFSRCKTCWIFLNISCWFVCGGLPEKQPQIQSFLAPNNHKKTFVRAEQDWLLQLVRLKEQHRSYLQLVLALAKCYLFIMYWFTDLLVSIPHQRPAVSPTYRFYLAASQKVFVSFYFCINHFFISKVGVVQSKAQMCLQHENWNMTLSLPISADCDSNKIL